jgi:hypothetical protein
MDTESTLGPARPALLLTAARGPAPGRAPGRHGSRPYRGVAGLVLAAGLTAAAGASLTGAAFAALPGGARSVAVTEWDDPVADMKADLRRLVSANEVYHVKNSRYAGDVGSLSSFRPSQGVSVTILNASANGWSAKATDAALPGKSCVIYVGSVPAPPKTDTDGRSGPEAVAVCDKA